MKYSKHETMHYREIFICGFICVLLMSHSTKWNHQLGLALLTDERSQVHEIFISDFIAFVTHSSKWVHSELRSQSDLGMSWITVCFRTLEINLSQWCLVVILTLQIKMTFCYGHAEFVASLLPLLTHYLWSLHLCNYIYL